MTRRNREEKEKKEKSDQAIAIFKARLKFLRRAQEFSKADNVVNAVKQYHKYLGCLALYFDIEEKKLSPSYFDQKDSIAEMLLISHVYWDLAKAYDRSPNLRHESLRCLDQFTKFTVGYKYQHVNYQLVKNFIRSKKAYNTKAFKHTLDKIKLSSKSCYVATFCYGVEHQITIQLRTLRDEIWMHNLFGRYFIKIYYILSPPLVRICTRYPRLGKFLSLYFFKPVIKQILRIYTNVNLNLNLNKKIK